MTVKGVWKKDLSVVRILHDQENLEKVQPMAKHFKSQRE